MKKSTSNNVVVLITTFLALTLGSCTKNTVNESKTQTFEELKKKYNLIVSSEVNERNSISFATVAEADKFLSKIKNAKPLTTITSGKISSENSNSQSREKKTARHSVTLTTLGGLNSLETVSNTSSYEGPGPGVYPITSPNYINTYRVDVAYNRDDNNVHTNLSANMSISNRFRINRCELPLNILFPVKFRIDL